MKKKKKNLLTLSLKATFNKEQTKIFKFLTNESKKIFNHYMFSLNVYNFYKYKLYDDIFIMHINKQITKENINDTIVRKLINYYKNYSNNYVQYKINNNIIYKTIKNMNIIITHDNYDDYYLKIINKCILDNNIIFDSSNCDLLFYDIIKNILTTFYMNNFFSVRNSIIYKTKIKEHLNIPSFIKHVIQKTLKYNNSTLYTSKCYDILNNIYENLNSEQTIIRKLALYTLKDDKVYRDTIINIMDKVYESYLSYKELRLSGKYANKPKYKHEDDKFILPLFSKSFKRIGNTIRICLGKYVNNNYNDICKTMYNIKKKSYNYILYESANGNFKGSFTYINLPKQLYEKNIKLVTISPLYDGYKFNINYTYDNKSIDREYNKDENISIDLGMGNLMTIYDPNGEQYLIKGKSLIQMNERINNKIAIIQSNMNKCGHYKSNRIRDLFIKRENKIDNCFNQIVKKMYDLYNKKDKIIIGYNKSWKTNINIGKDNNRKFYQIPFRKLIKKLKDKFGENLIEIKEAYTSKTDSLAYEEITKQENYLGKRIKRGLFSSSKNKLVNADLNGAINIMRLYEIKQNGNDLKEIKGANIYNPKRITAYEV